MENTKGKAALVDLDGTLLPMDTSQFMQAYAKHAAKCLSAWGLGLEQQELVETLWRSMGALLQPREGEENNEQVFWRAFAQMSGVPRGTAEPYLNRYYLSNFAEMQVYCDFQPLVYDLLGELRRKGFDIVIATNPLFPRVALEKRMTWAGLQDEEIRLVTDWSVSHAAKPQQAYYLEILQTLGLPRKRCLMIGNDGRDDIAPVDALGMTAYMVTDCAMNADKRPPHVANGNFNMLLRWVRALPEEKGE